MDDIIDGLVRLMLTPDAVTGPLNLGNTEEMSILGLAQLTLELTESLSRIVHRPSLKMNPGSGSRTFRAEESLDWTPQTPLNKGLAAQSRTFGSF